MRKRETRIALHRETLRLLDAPTLRGPAGGAGATAPSACPCPSTYPNCPSTRFSDCPAGTCRC